MNALQIIPCKEQYFHNFEKLKNVILLNYIQEYKKRIF